MRRLLPALALLAVLAAGCGNDKNGDSASTPATAAEPAATQPTSTPSATPDSTQTATKPKITVPSGPPPKKLVTKDLKVGSGAAAKAGDQVTVQYVGVNYADGKQFDASWDRGQAFPFQLGAGAVIPGWDQGVVGMKPGGRRELIIPPDLAYGAQGQGPIAPNSTLIFVIDLQSIA